MKKPVVTADTGGEWDEQPVNNLRLAITNMEIFVMGEGMGDVEEACHVTLHHSAKGDEGWRAFACNCASLAQMHRCRTLQLGGENRMCRG